MCGLANWSVLVLLGIAGVIDWKKRELPIGLLGIMSGVIVIFAMRCQEIDVWYRIAGALMGVVFFVITRFTKEAIGYGDSWLFLILGIHMGVLQVLQLLLAASLMAAFFAIFYLWRHRWKRSETLPFVPFLAIAYVGVMLI